MKYQKMKHEQLAFPLDELGSSAPNEKAGMTELERIRTEYENSPEYRLGSEIIDGLTQQFGMSAEDAAALLGSGRKPGGIEAISVKAGQELAAMAMRGMLKRPPEEYLGDPEFVSLLPEMPVKMAIRVYDAENEARHSAKRVEEERDNAMRDVIEKLRARSALPRQMRFDAPVSAETDYSKLSSEEFNRAKKRHLSAIAGK